MDVVSGCVLVYRYTEGITIVLLCLRPFVELLHIVGSFVSVLVYRYTRTELGTYLQLTEA